MLLFFKLYSFSILGIPPPPPTAIPTHIPVDPGLKNKAEPNENASEISLDTVIGILETSTAQAEERGYLEAKKAGEIKKRLGMFKNKWTNDQLNDKVKIGMFKLAELIQKEDYDQAEKIQRSLNVDYPSLCTPWMIAIRQLIFAQNSADNKTDSWNKSENMKFDAFHFRKLLCIVFSNELTSESSERGGKNCVLKIEIALLNTWRNFSP